MKNPEFEPSPLHIALSMLSEICSRGPELLSLGMSDIASSIFNLVQHFPFQKKKNNKGNFVQFAIFPLMMYLMLES